MRNDMFEGHDAHMKLIKRLFLVIFVIAILGAAAQMFVMGKVGFAAADWIERQ